MAGRWVGRIASKQDEQPLTGIVWLPCRFVMAACASWWELNLTKAQPATKEGKHINTATKRAPKERMFGRKNRVGIHIVWWLIINLNIKWR